MTEQLNETGQLLRDHIKKKGLTPEKVSRDAGINKQQLYSVLRMGEPKRPDYKISTLLRLIDYLGLKIKFKKG